MEACRGYTGTQPWWRGGLERKASGGRKRGSGASQRKGEEPGGRGSEQVLRLGNSPSRGVSELSLGQARSPREPGQWGLHLPAWCCLLLSAVPRPAKASRPGETYSPHQRTAPSPSSGTSHLALGVRPSPLPTRWRPKLPFLRGRGSEGEETPTHARCSVRGDQTRGGNSPGNMPLLCR